MQKKKKELFLIIIWKNAFDQKKEIIKDLKKKFDIRNIFNVVWRDENWSNNLSRFYGTSLPDKSAKEIHCGKDLFIAIILEDPNPKYETRQTSRGLEKVNSNIFDAKTKYREWTGGGHKIHASNDEFETNHDLTLLFGTNIKDFLKKYKKSEKIKNYNRDIVGTEKWDSIEQLFYVLNNCCKYVILRDYDDDFKGIQYSNNYDIDALCENEDDVKWIINAEKVYIDNHIQYSTKIGVTNCLFDLKTIDDGYYCYKHSKDILKNRVLHHGYYIPNDEYAYYSCLYHALVHKFNFETEYNARLAYVFPKFHDANLSKEHYVNKVSKWMKEKKYIVTIQNDNPYKMNVDNIRLFDKKLYDDKIFGEIIFRKRIKDLENEMLVLQNEIKEKNSVILEKDKIIKDINNNLELVINSKGWNLLEKYRRIRNKVMLKNK